ncbi:MAG TPA: glycosyltransferase family 4 protein [Ignavibacteria bacterium]|nr:glycosyltransferase family 4 protein [Ignavibacteria bacterium]
MESRSYLNAGIKKRIIMIGSLPPPYHGSNVYFHNLLNSELKDNFDISHLDISDHRNLDNLSKLDLTNVYLALKNLIMLFVLIKKIKPELIYIPIASNFLPYLRDGLFILLSSYFSKAGIVIHLHEGNFFRKVFYYESGYFNKKFIEYSLSKVNTAIVYTEALKSNFEGFVKNIVAFPNGLKTETITDRNIIKQRSSENIQINFMGNFFESKGVLEIIKAAAIVTEKRKDVTFNLAGTWLKNEEKTRLKAEDLIKENQLGSVVKFRGILTGKEKNKFMEETDIFLFPTWYPYEGCPMVILDVMSFGKPVISTKDTGAIPEMVIDGETGILTEPKNVEQIAKAILKLIDNIELMIQMGKTGRERFEKLFTMEINTENIINTFKKVIK